MPSFGTGNVERLRRGELAQPQWFNSTHPRPPLPSNPPTVPKYVVEVDSLSEQESEVTPYKLDVESFSEREKIETERRELGWRTPLTLSDLNRFKRRQHATSLGPCIMLPSRTHCSSIPWLTAAKQYVACHRRSDPITSQIERQGGGSVASISGGKVVPFRCSVRPVIR